MKLRYQNENDFEKKEEKGEAGEGKSRLRELCSKLWDATKKGAGILCFAAGTAIAVNGCGGGINQNDDAKIETVEENDGENSDANNEIIEDANNDGEVIQACLGQSSELEGEVVGPITNKKVSTTILNGFNSEIEGDMEMTIGGRVDGAGILILGECQDKPDAIVAFGAQGSTLIIEPQHRIDLGKTFFRGEFPPIEDELCPVPAENNIPVSIYNENTNTTVKKISVGTIDAGGEIKFTRALSPGIFVNGAPAILPITFDDANYTLKTITIGIENSPLEATVTIYSNEGEKLIVHTLSNLISGNSKTLRVYQINQDNLMIPGLAAEAKNQPEMCLRTENNEPKEVTGELLYDLTGILNDECGNIFASFDIVPLTATITYVDPTFINRNYSVVSVSGSTVDALKGKEGKISITLRREHIVPDPGTVVSIDGIIDGYLTSKDNNPTVNLPDNIAFRVTFRVIDPHALNYPTKCGYAVPRE